MSEWMIYVAWYAIGLPGAWIVWRSGHPLSLAFVALALGPIGTIVVLLKA